MIDNDETVFLVVMNEEEQYSIWPEFKEIPSGWMAEGTRGLKGACLEHIDRVWIDMRRKSTRQ